MHYQGYQYTYLQQNVRVQTHEKEVEAITKPTTVPIVVGLAICAAQACCNDRIPCLNDSQS